MITADATALASQNLADQLNDRDGTCVSLSALWRSVGSPTGRDPASWLSVAAPLIEGLRAYLANLDATIDPLGQDGMIGDLDPCEVWRNDQPDGEALQVGDLMTSYLIARHYAEHLDARAGSDARSEGQSDVRKAIEGRPRLKLIDPAE
jgi:hypothetical protein